MGIENLNKQAGSGCTQMVSGGGRGGQLIAGCERDFGGFFRSICQYGSAWGG